jgi:prepilin-type N-terminal cleavage/methylation domain-containing protein/prepilin-type processing-associated H-X9-DG protein
MKFQHHGFTLIELLVVIAIISILASMLMPVFSQAKEKARQVDCMSNLKQICYAMLMYVQDNDELFPLAFPFWAPIYSLPVEPNLKSVTMSYVKNDQVWWCRSWVGVYGYNRWGNPSGGCFDYIIPTAQTFPVIGDPRTGPAHGYAQISRPSDYPLLFCGSPWPQTLLAHEGGGDSDFFAGKGTGATNICFADSHVKFTKFDLNTWNTLYLSR